MPATKLNPKTTALLLLDYQSAPLEMMSPEPASAIERARLVLESARAAGATVIYVNLAFRGGHPEIHPRNRAMVAAFKDRNAMLAAPVANLVPPALVPQATDLEITKRRIGAFYGTELDMVLRARGIDTIVVMGLATSGAVLSTVLWGFDADYSMSVVRDCCFDPDTNLHETLFEKVLPRQAAIVSASEVASAFSAS